MTENKKGFHLSRAFRSRLCAVTLIGLVFLLTAFFFRWMRQDPPSAADHPSVGRGLLDLHLQGPEPSESVEMDDLRGSVVLLNFWGIWCPPCRAELPHMVALTGAFDGIAGVRVLAVSCGAPGETEQIGPLRKQTRDYLAGRRLKMPVYTDIGGFTRRNAEMALSGHLFLQAYPTTLLIDRGARIRAVWIGYAPGSEIEMRRQIERLLARYEVSSP